MWRIGRIWAFGDWVRSVSISLLHVTCRDKIAAGAAGTRQHSRASFFTSPRVPVRTILAQIGRPSPRQYYTISATSSYNVCWHTNTKFHVKLHYRIIQFTHIHTHTQTHTYIIYIYIYIYTCTWLCQLWYGSHVTFPFPSSRSRLLPSKPSRSLTFSRSPSRLLVDHISHSNRECANVRERRKSLLERTEGKVVVVRYIAVGWRQSMFLSCWLVGRSDHRESRT